MLNRFDWLRQSRTGAELLATLRYFADHSDLPTDKGEIGSPYSALHGPCERCQIYPPAKSKTRYCATCRAVLSRAWRLGDVSRHASVLWGFVNRLPKQLCTGSGFRDSHILGAYSHDDNHFLLMLPRRDLKPWFQELAIYHGADLQGLIQVFPTTGSRNLNMGEVFCRIAHGESRFPMDRLRVRFFSDPYHVLNPRRFDRQGILTFESAEFLSLLEMASVFRTVLRPREQELLRKILATEDAQEEQLYWGRFLGYLNQKARDMLSAWNVRNWSKPQTRLLYELIDYVVFYQTY